MRRSLLSLTFLLFVTCTSLQAGTFTSAGPGPSAWNSAATWVATGDADGIPDPDDDVTIQAGHTVTNNAVGYCRHFTINGTFQGLSGNVLIIYGDYTVTGIETGIGAFGFTGVNGLMVSGSGTFGTGIRYHFAKDRTIAAGTTIIKNVTVRISRTITNLGNVNLSVFQCDAGSAWINSTNSTLTLRAAGFMPSGTTFDASASGNTVNLNYVTGAVPLSTGGYFNLNISGSSGTKTMSANTTVAGNLTINASNTLNTNNFDLNIGGNFTRNGTLTASAGKTVTFNGTSAQSLVVNGTTAQTFYNLDINNSNGVTLTSGSITIMESLTANAGVFDAGTNSVTLFSDATSTARIGVTGATAGYSGSNYIMQRFISSRNTNWADMASPAQNSTINDWDQEIYMSGVGGNDGNACCPVWYSIYNYSEPTDTWLPVTSIATSTSPGVGFELYLGTSSTAMSALTMDTRGTPTFGTLPVSVTNTGSNATAPGWNLIGNPYASALSWTSFQGSNPTLDDEYQVFDAGTGNYAVYGLGTDIPHTQGFWVFTSSSTTVNFMESHKSTSNSSTYLRTLPEGEFSLGLTNNVNSLSHKSRIRVNSSASRSVEWGGDVAYLKSPAQEAPSITFVEDGKELVIDEIGAEAQASIAVKVRAGVDGVYTIEASGFEGIKADYSCIVLEDKEAGMMIDLQTQSRYTFDAKAGEIADRFVLHLNSSDETCSSLRPAASSDDAFIFSNAEGVFVQFSSSTDENVTITVNNILGQSVIENVRANTSQGLVKIDVPQDQSGIYFVNVQFGNKNITEKIFLQRK